LIVLKEVILNFYNAILYIILIFLYKKAAVGSVKGYLNDPYYKDLALKKIRNE
jgi:hypothetical protein